MKKKLFAVLSYLNISAFSKAGNKRVLTDDQKSELGEHFSAEEIEKIEQEIADEASEDTTFAEDFAQKNTELSELKNTLNSVNLQLTTEQGNNTSNVAEQKRLQDEVVKLKQTITTLSMFTEQDPKQKGKKNEGSTTDSNINSEFLFSNETPWMKIDESHPYNQRMYSAIMRSHGIVVPYKEAAEQDYKKLEDDLGEYYNQRKQEDIIAYLRDLPSVENIYPTLSGEMYKDKFTLTNVFMGDFGQPWKRGRKFQDVIKGKFTFEPETGHMFDGLFAYQFDDLKDIEHLWIANYSRDSQVIKLGFVEFLLQQVSRKLFNEHELCSIGGKYVQPTDAKIGSFMDVSDGIYEHIYQKINTTFQIKEFELGEMTTGNIVDYIYRGTEQIPSQYRGPGMVECHMPERWVNAYLKNMEFLYGINPTYKEDQMYVHGFKNVKIVSIPYSGNFDRVYWTFGGNFNRLEYILNERYKFSLEQEDWSLKVWSNWKESLWGAVIGKQYASKAEQTYTDQYVWCNDKHLASTYFVSIPEDEATPSAASHNRLLIPANTEATAITDILGVAVGGTVVIKWGSTVHPSTFAKSGKFSLISSAITDAQLNDELGLMKRSDGKFIELYRVTNTTDAIVLAKDDATPTVAGGLKFITQANTVASPLVPVVITNFDNATEGATYTIYGGSDTNSATIETGGNFVLTAKMTLGIGTFIKLILIDSVFNEIERG